MTRFAFLEREWAMGIPRRIAGSFRRLFRREPAPGRWIDGAASSWHGLIRFRPWVFPRRHFRLYLPRGHSRWRRTPLIVLLHGCRQTAAELAQGARIAPMADAIGALVLMPDQADAANPYRCWNWFDARTVAGKGEAAIVAAMIRKVRHRRRIDLRRLVVGGMSAGGALAAVVGVRYPRLVGGVFVHSGLAAGAAASDFSALSVMRRGPDNDVAAFAREARRVSRSTALVPLLVLQGNRDDVVAARNAAALARQYLAFNGVDVPPGSESTLPPADRDERDGADVRRMTRTREWQRDGLPLVRLVEMDGLGHAWCGGDATLPFNQAGPPDATALLGEWLLTAVARDRR